MDTPILNFRKLVKYSLFLLFGLLLLSYALWQARLLLVGPVITLSDMPTTHTEHTITLTGQAENIVGITLNDRAIYTDKNGHFTEQLVLENGYTLATLEATDRYGRSAVVERAFVYTP